MTNFPFLSERFGDRWSSAVPKDASIFNAELIKAAIGSAEVPVEVSINRSLSLALYLANTGAIPESRQACQNVIAAVTKGGYDISRTLHWEAIQKFLEDGGEDSVMSDATHNAKQDLAHDVKRWSDELFRNRPKLNRSTWRNRIDPLDTLRCASLFLVPSFGSPSATQKDELEGLEALKHFLSLSLGKPYLAFRRAQAFWYAIDTATKHDKLDEAWALALSAIEGPNHLFPGTEASFVLFPHFGPVFLQSCTAAATSEGRKAIERMSSVIFVEGYEDNATASLTAAVVPGLLDEELNSRLDTADKAGVEKMPPFAHLREIERVSRRAGVAFKLREGADHVAIAEAEKRIGYSLPDEYKTLLRIANGWEGDSETLPALARIEEVAIVQVSPPLPITTHASKKNPYNKDATFSSALLISSPSSASKLYLIKDSDLTLDRNRDGAGPSGAKRVKGNDGQPVDFEKGDYRVALINFPSDSKKPEYFSMVRGVIDHAIKSYDAEAGVGAREECRSKIYKRRIPGESPDADDGDNDEDGDDDEDDGGEDGGDGDENSDENNNADASTITQLIKPICWYGTECRTKDHNADHAARYDHTGPNTRSNS